MSKRSQGMQHMFHGYLLTGGIMFTRNCGPRRAKNKTKSLEQAIPWSYSLHGFYICTWHHIRLLAPRLLFIFFSLKKNHHQRFDLGTWWQFGGWFYGLYHNHKSNNIWENIIWNFFQASSKQIQVIWSTTS